MGVVHNRNPCDLAFHIWMSGYPETNHPLDMRRFFVFARTVATYGNKKWRDPDHFACQILQRKPFFDQQRIRRFAQLLEDCIEFYHAKPVPLRELDTNLPAKDYDRSVRNGIVSVDEIAES